MAFYGYRIIWCIGVAGLAITKASLNWPVHNFYAGFQPIPAPVQGFFEAARGVPLPASILEVLLAGLPYLPASEYPVAHGVVVVLTSSAATFGALINFRLMTIVMAPVAPVSAVLPTVSSCVSYYADRETWAALILLMGLSKAIINWGILAFYLDPANVP
ncbi:hypothetical protein MTO96_044811, partial [Rhipicephalus appendiculatus]